MNFYMYFPHDLDRLFLIYCYIRPLSIFHTLGAKWLHEKLNNSKTIQYFLKRFSVLYSVNIWLQFTTLNFYIHPIEHFGWYPLSCDLTDKICALFCTFLGISWYKQSISMTYSNLFSDWYLDLIGNPIEYDTLYFFQTT